MISQTVFTVHMFRMVIQYSILYCTYRLLSIGGFIKGILRGVRCTKSLRVLFLHRRPPSWTTLVLYSRAVFIFNEPTFGQNAQPHVLYEHIFIFLSTKDVRMWEIANQVHCTVLTRVLYCVHSPDCIRLVIGIEIDTIE